MNLKVSTFYLFTKLAEPELTQQRLLTAAARHDIHGLMIIGNEGINATVSGEGDSLTAFLSEVALCLGVEPSALTIKTSPTSKHPFAKFKCRIRPEIVTTHNPDLHPDRVSGTHLSPKAWQRMLENESEDVVVVDTRNWYETKLGKFKSAVDLKLDQFGDFASAIGEANFAKNKKYLLYCTGGIRCEKAVVDMKQLGFEHVYQLEGGILNYLKELPHRDFEGECFVFDYRVAVDQELNPSARYRLCPHCGQPGDQPITCEQCASPAITCQNCPSLPHKHTCSKNCAHHHRMGHRSKRPILNQKRVPTKACSESKLDARATPLSSD